MLTARVRGPVQAVRGTWLGRAGSLALQRLALQRRALQSLALQRLALIEVLALVLLLVLAPACSPGGNDGGAGGVDPGRTGATGGASSPGSSPPAGANVGGDGGQAGAGGRGSGGAAAGGTGGGEAAAGTGGASLQPDGGGDVSSAEAAEVGPGVSEPLPGDPACNLVLGIKQTGEWFSAGFEAIVDNARWEVVPVHNGHIELWADPKNAIWGQKPQSPCTSGAATPDRIIFVGTNYDYTTVDEFLPKYLAVIENIKAKFASVKRIELQTHVRAPGNVACPGALDFKTTIKPAQDEALTLAVAKYPGLVVASPKFEVDSCADYGLYPHFKGGGAAAVAKKIGAHYKAR